MTVEKGIILSAEIGGSIIILLVVSVIGAYWWANTPPNRPPSIHSKSVWLWAPSVDFRHRSGTLRKTITTRQITSSG
jgi:hypothetical protein